MFYLNITVVNLCAYQSKLIRLLQPRQHLIFNKVNFVFCVLFQLSLLNNKTFLIVLVISTNPGNNT